MAGAGTTYAGAGLAGADPQTLSTPVAPMANAAQYDPRTRTLVTNADGSVATVHPVDQTVAFALTIKLGTISSVPTVGFDFDRLRSTLPDARPQAARDLVPEQAAAGLETLAQPQRRLLRRQRLQQAAQARHRRRQQQQAAFGVGAGRGEIGLDAQGLRQLDFGQVARVAPLLRHRLRLRGVARPQHGVVPGGECGRHRRAPGAGTEDRDLHVVRRRVGRAALRLGLQASGLSSGR